MFYSNYNLICNYFLGRFQLSGHFFSRSLFLRFSCLFFTICNAQECARVCALLFDELKAFKCFVVWLVSGSFVRYICAHVVPHTHAYRRLDSVSKFLLFHIYIRHVCVSIRLLLCFLFYLFCFLLQRHLHNSINL